MTLAQMRGFLQAQQRIDGERQAGLAMAVRAGSNADAKEFKAYIDDLLGPR